MKIFTDIDDMQKASEDLGKALSLLTDTMGELESVLHDMQVSWQGEAGQRYAFEMRRKLRDLRDSYAAVKKMKENADRRIESAASLDRACRQLVQKLTDVSRAISGGMK